MKILNIVQSLDPAWGGIARVLPELAGGLARAGETCRIATLAGGRYGQPAAMPEGVEVLQFDAPDGSRLGKSPTFDAAIGDLAADADVVHLHGLWTGQNRSAGKAARSANTPLVITPHSHMMPWAWRRGRWKKRIAGWLFEHKNLRSAARLHALAQGEAEAMRALGFNDRIEIIPNGLHVADYATAADTSDLLARFPELRGRRWLLFLGRIAEQKGIVQTMQACFDAAAAGGDWHLIIAGPDEFGMQSMLEAAIARKGVSERVTFTGMLSRNEVRACLGGASLLLQPSRSEGLSLSILEALACGVPVIISQACNLPEVAAADAGRVVTPDRHGVAVALRELLSMADADRQAMRGRARRLAAERFDWNRIIPRYQQMYQQVADG